MDLKPSNPKFHSCNCPLISFVLLFTLFTVSEPLSHRALVRVHVCTASRKKCVHSCSPSEYSVNQISSDMSLLLKVSHSRFFHFRLAFPFQF